MDFMGNKRMNISDFTKSEIEVLESECNFTPDENELFLLRAQNFTLEQSAERMNISSKTAYRINIKIMSIKCLYSVLFSSYLVKYNRGRKKGGKIGATLSNMA